MFVAGLLARSWLFQKAYFLDFAACFVYVLTFDSYTLDFKSLRFCIEKNDYCR